MLLLDAICSLLHIFPYKPQLNLLVQAIDFHFCLCFELVVSNTLFFLSCHFVAV